MKSDKPIIIISGPSGVGKSTLVRHLINLEPKFKKIYPYTIRNTRKNDDKIHVSLRRLKYLEKLGVVAVFKHYGSFYGEPISKVKAIQKSGNVPIMDISINYVKKWLTFLGCDSIVIYLLPESLAVLKKRSTKIGKDPSGERMVYDKKEMGLVKSGRYNDVIDLVKINSNSMETAKELAPLLKKMTGKKLLFVCKDNIRICIAAAAMFNALSKNSVATWAGYGNIGKKDIEIRPGKITVRMLLKQRHNTSSHKRARLTKQMFDSADKVISIIGKEDEKGALPRYSNNSKKVVFWQIGAKKRIDAPRTKQLDEIKFLVTRLVDKIDN